MSIIEFRKTSKHFGDLKVLDEVRLYRPGAAGHRDGGWEAVDGGDQHPNAQRERAEVQSSFNLSPSGTAPTTVYLRIRTQGSSLLRPWVFSPGMARST